MSEIPIHIALVAEEASITPTELMRVSAALQKQVVRDFYPIWGKAATVDPFAKLEDVPGDMCLLVIMDEIPNSAAEGIHEDKDGRPIALVKFDSAWSLTASHECLEMIADPNGYRYITGNSPIKGQGHVFFLVEVCDPCEDPRYGYSVDGVLVSDFYTPHFFDTQNGNYQYSFNRSIGKPLQVLTNGYLTWRDPATGHFWQESNFSGKMRMADLGVLSGTSATTNRRSQVDRVTRAYDKYLGTEIAPALQSFVSRADNWRGRIAEIIRES